jgi:hypothetical protein
MAKKAKKAKPANTTKPKKAAQMAVEMAAAAPAAMVPVSDDLPPNHSLKRYPGSDGKSDILCRWEDGQGTVCKPVAKGGGWDDPPP